MLAMLRKIIFILKSLGLLVLGLSSMSVTSAEQIGKLEQSELIEGKNIKLLVDCVENKDFKITRDVKGRSFIGTDGEPPICVLSELRVNVDDRALPIPNRAIVDLSNVRLDGAEIKVRQEQLLIRLRGGDGLGSYSVRFIFEKGILIRREIEDRDSKERIRIRVSKFGKR